MLVHLHTIPNNEGNYQDCPVKVFLLILITNTPLLLDPTPVETHLKLLSLHFEDPNHAKNKSEFNHVYNKFNITTLDCLKNNRMAY